MEWSIMSLELVRNLPYNHPYRWDGSLFGGVKLWTPAEIQLDTIMWYDAYDESTLTESGGVVSEWRDKSDSLWHLGQPVVTERPVTGTRKINGINALDFDDPDFMNKTSGINYFFSQFTFLAVATNDDTANFKDYFLLYNSVGNDEIRCFRYFGDVMRLVIDNGDGLALAADSPVGLGTGVQLIGGYYDGVNIFSGLNAAYITGDSASGSIDIDAIEFCGNNYDGAFGEFIMIPTVDLAKRQLMEGYLAHKWGIEATLPAGHPYKSAPPTI
jgi:hypothetical protein